LNTSLFEDVPTHGSKFENEERLHEKMAGKATGETLAHKLHNKPVTDLKAAIGINEKFLFINKLFGGSLQNYSEAIERINTAGSLTSAKQIIDEEFSPKYNWQADSLPVKEFIDLVERRFIS